MVVGDMADSITGGQRTSVKKNMDAGFNYQFPQLDEALKNIYAEES
jgi:NAD dependent epimerase/dehydratase family enzyme